MNATISRLAWRSTFGQKRGWLLVGLAGLLIVVAAAMRMLADGSSDGGETVVTTLGFVFILPMLCLLVANGVLGPEMEDGSVIYLLSKPVSRYVVAASKALVALVISVALGAASIAAAQVISGESDRVLPAIAAASVAAVAYTGVFIALAAGRRGVVTGIAYVLVLETVLVPILPALRYFSAQAFGLSVGDALNPDLVAVRPMTGVPYALVAALVFLVAGTAWAGYQLARFQLTGED